MSGLFTEEVFLVRSGPSTERDDYGNDVPGPRERVSWKVWLEPRESGESTDAQHQTISGYWVAGEGHPDLESYEHIEIGGKDYDVDGEPGRVPAGFRIEAFTKVAVKRVEG